MLVVWTDESGDDASRLETAIDICRQKDIPVHIVGPSAVLGAETGCHTYQDPKSEVEYLLPVTRGPDTAVPERLRLGYWFRTRQPPGASGPALPAWYGGHDLAGISSPFSPFALTRLAIQSGGSFTILDDPADRAPFDLESMKQYQPLYESEEQYRELIELYPLRAAVLAAVQETRGQNELTLPPLLLFGERSEVPPYPFEAPYLSPEQFQRKLRTEHAGLIRQTETTARRAARALAHVSSHDDIDQDLEALYRQETSPRWRAWYDLTRGRLLATLVRLEEYRLACEDLAPSGAINSSTNFISFEASRSLRSSQVFQARGQEARLLLLRCVQQNPDTPWQYLAQRELDYAFGVFARQLALQHTGGAPRSKPSLPRF